MKYDFKRSQLVTAAQELNEVLQCDPPIKLDGTMEELETSVIEAVELTSVEDKFTQATSEIVDEIWKGEGFKEPESAKEPEPVKEPESAKEPEPVKEPEPAPAVRRGPGRPPKAESAKEPEPAPAAVRRGPGRPPKAAAATEEKPEPAPAVRRGPGRPSKAAAEEKPEPAASEAAEEKAQATKTASVREEAMSEKEKILKQLLELNSGMFQLNTYLFKLLGK